MWLAVASAWLFVAVAVVRSRVRDLPHRRWLAGLETLRGWESAEVGRRALTRGVGGGT